MIIVSQDESTIYNLDNIISIKVERINAEYYLVAEAGTHSVCMGWYRTEARATKVLQEIIQLYSKDTYKREIPEGNGVYRVKEINHPLPKVYKMPEEV